MKSRLSFLLLSLSSSLLLAAPPSLTSDGLRITPLRPGVFVHTTTEQKIEANGLLVKLGTGFLLVDTGWHPEETEKILDWAEKEIGGKCLAAVITHSHSDRSGGVQALGKRSIPVFASEATAATLNTGSVHVSGVLSPANPNFEDTRGFALFYPGAAHSSDNIVVWFPQSHVLFGGCLVRPAAAKDLGTTTDASLGAWPSTLRAVEKKFPAAEVVVPGHGEPGSRHLLTHTLALLSSAPAVPQVPAPVATPAPKPVPKKKATP